MLKKGSIILSSIVLTAAFCLIVTTVCWADVKEKSWEVGGFGDGKIEPADLERYQAKRKQDKKSDSYIDQEVGAVKSSIEAGAEAAAKVGELICANVIPSAHDDVFDLIGIQK